VDEHTAAAINDVEALINDIQNQLNSGSSGEKLYDTDDPLVGKPPADSETAAKALDDKVKAAQDAVAGDSVGIEVTLDDFVWDDESGDYKKDEVTGELIPLTTTVTYIVYDTKKIKDAETELKKAIEAAKEAQVGAYVSSVITLSSRNTDDSDKDWKSVTIVNDGVYKITISGANGGHAWSQTNTLKFGGKGGYVVAQKDFKKGDVLKIRIGTEGKGLAIFDGQDLVKSSEITTAGQPGGWPNGGSGGKPVGTSSSDISTPGSGGGGATDVYYVGSRETGASATLKTPGEKGQLGNLTRNNDCLLLVAGGGGGAGSAKRVSTALGRSAMAGGDAGSGDSNRNAGTGAIPATWTGNYTNSTVKTYTLAAALSEPYTNIKTSVAYDKLNITSDNKYYGEYAKNDIVTYDTGASGQGVNGANGDTGKERAWEACGGGGGGYYGGNAIKTNYTGGGGGGGSNYIGSGFSNTTNDTSGVYGNGAFKIEYVSAN
jgi:hypothetical protein